MDEDSDIDKDLDNSLMDPYHGLDSSTEEGDNPDDTLADSGEGKDDEARAPGTNQEHVSMLEDMVQEMKQGFQAALEELAKIQDKEDGAQSRLLQQQQQLQIDELKSSVDDIKEQITSLIKVVAEVQGENKKLKENVQILQAQIQSKGFGPEEPMMVPADSSLEWTESGTHNPFESDENHNSPTELVEIEREGPKSDEADDVTAIACKSLSLTQALGEKYLEFNISASSEDGEESGNRRASSIMPKAGGQTEESNRRHSMPASALMNSRSKQMARAAQRQAAVKELADAERDYCSQLWALLDTYLTPLQTTTFLTGDQLDLLFPPFLERLYMEHCMICSGLQDKLVHWSFIASIANLLSRITESHTADSILSMYHEYSEFLPDAINCLRDALTHSLELRSFLKTIQKSSCQTNDLITLIIAPVQHLPKYLLQLQQVCRHTPSTHPDYLLLQTSLNRLRGFVEQINEHVSSAMATVSQDSRTGSSNDSSQVLSARDSGVHSNEEEVPLSRNFFRSEQNLSPEDWQDDMFYSPRSQLRTRSGSFFHDQWQRGEEQRKLSPHYSALSQPDLTRFDAFLGLSPAFTSSGPFSHIPRSQSGLPTNGANQMWGNSREGNGGRRKYKLRPSPVAPNAFQAAENPHMLPSPRSRPSSAIDFTNSHLHPYQSQHHDFAAPQARPRSAMAQMAPLDPHHRPTIISRKHGRRSQPPVSNSGYWAENASLLQHKHSQNKMVAPPLDLLPSRPSPLPTHASLEDDEEDDTRASDLHSFGTSGGSQRHSSSHCSRDDRELDLDLRQVLSESEQSHDQEPRANEFSEEDVAASLAWKLCADSSVKNVTDSLKDIQDTKTSNEMLSSNGKVIASLDIKVEERSDIQKPALSKSLEDKQGTPHQLSRTKESHKSSDKNGSQDEIALPSSGSKVVLSSCDDSSKDIDSPKASNNTNSHTDQSLESALDQINGDVSDFNSNTHSDDQGQHKSSDSSSNGQNMMEHNRQFLLSLAQSPNRSLKSESSGSKKKFSSSVQISLKNNKQEGSEKKIETTFSASASFDESDSQDTSPSVQSYVPPKAGRRSVPTVSSHLTNSFSGLNGQGMIRTSSPNAQHKDLSKSASNPDRTEKGDSLWNTGSENADKPRGGNTNNFLETAIDDSSINSQDKGFDAGDQKASSDTKMTRSLDMSELFITDDSKERRRDRKKVKESSSTYHPSDNLPKANDDPVGARKKMHLKSSLKNLFSKKRGRVMMADVEREVILEMASEALTSKSPPSRASSLSPTATPMSNKLCEKNDTIKASNPNCNTEIPTVLENHKMTNVFEIRLKTDQGNSTDSPVRISQSKNGSPPSNKKTEKGNSLEQSVSSQNKSWYDFLPFTQKKSPSQSTPTDQMDKSKKSSPSANRNKSSEKNSALDEKPMTSKQDSKSSESNGLNSCASKHQEKPKGTQSLSNPMYYFNLQQSSIRGKNYKKADSKPVTLEGFSQQQHKKFQDQVKKYTKLKQKGKGIDPSTLENQLREKLKEKELKTRGHRHRERSSSNHRKSTEINQCSNCQMKAKRISSQEPTTGDPLKSSSQGVASRKHRHQHHHRRSGEISLQSSNTSNFQLEDSHASHNSRTLTNEGMYVTFSHGPKLSTQHATFDSSRPSYPYHSERTDEKKSDSIDSKSKTSKSKSGSKSNNLSHDLNLESNTSSSHKQHVEKSFLSSGKLLSSLQSGFPLADGKMNQSRQVPQTSHLSSCTTNNLSFPYYNTNGLNGLTFSGAPRCYSGNNIPCKNGINMQGTQFTADGGNGHGKTELTIPESVKRRNGGEYNNLSLDVHLNSLQADPVQKSYVKRVPWHGGGNISSDSPPFDEETQKRDSDHLLQPLYDGRENQDMVKDKTMFGNSTNAVGNLASKTNISKPCSTSNSQHKGQEFVPKSQDGKEDESSVGVNRVSPVEGEQNWEELLTPSHEYFNSKYRLCFDDDEQDVKNSTPPPAIERSTTQESIPSTHLSLERSHDNSAYVAFVSCPVISSSSQDQNHDPIYKNLPSFTDSVKATNGMNPKPAFSSPVGNPSTFAPLKPLNETSSLSVNGKESADKNSPRKIPIINLPPTNKETDESINPVYNKSLDVLSNGTDPTNRTANGDKSTLKPVTNHIISSISVANSCKAPVSPTTANQIYLPVSLANGNMGPMGPLSSHTGSCFSFANGNKSSLITKDIDYSKSMTNGSGSKSFPAKTPAKELTIASSNSKEISSCVSSKTSNGNGNLIPRQDSPSRPTSLFVNQEMSSPAPKSLQKLFPSKSIDPVIQHSDRQTSGSTDKGLYLNGAIGSDEEISIQTVSDKRREDIRKLTIGHMTMMPNHHMPTSLSESHRQHFGHLNGGSPLHDTDKKSQPSIPFAQNHKTDDKIRSNGKNSYPLSLDPSSSSNPLFSFGKYTIDNSSQYVPKSFSEFLSENKEYPQNSHCDSSNSTKDTKAISVAKRETKNFPSESSRYSSCSSHSANEIQIVKFSDLKDTFCCPNIKESVPQSAKNEFERNTLQVRYTPKTGIHKRGTADTNGHGGEHLVSTSSSMNSNPPSYVLPESFPIAGVAVTVHQSSITSEPCKSLSDQMSSMSGYANEVLPEKSAFASPDLLQVSFAVPGSSQMSEALNRQTLTPQSETSLTSATPQPKKQSFLARLAHTPLSFLNRDSKNATESK